MKKFLSFVLTKDIHAMLPTEQVAEILNLPPDQIAPIPDMPPAVLGICNWRGGILWLLDLAQILDFKPLYAQDWRQQNYRILILQTKNNILGVAVNQVGQMINCEEEQIKRPPGVKNKPLLANCLKGQWQNPNGKTLLLLDAEALCAIVSNAKDPSEVLRG